MCKNVLDIDFTDKIKLGSFCEKSSTIYYDSTDVHLNAILAWFLEPKTDLVLKWYPYCCTGQNLSIVNFWQ